MEDLRNNCRNRAWVRPFSTNILLAISATLATPVVASDVTLSNFDRIPSELRPSGPVSQSVKPPPSLACGADSLSAETKSVCQRQLEERLRANTQDSDRQEDASVALRREVLISCTRTDQVASHRHNGGTASNLVVPCHIELK